MGEVVLSTDRLDRVIDISTDEVTLQPGVPLTVLKEQLAGQGLFYPPVPTFDGAFAGGVVATNAAGATTFKYGSTRDWVRRLTVVLADGEAASDERLERLRVRLRAGRTGATDGRRLHPPPPPHEEPPS